MRAKSACPKGVEVTPIKTLIQRLFLTPDQDYRKP